MTKPLIVLSVNDPLVPMIPRCAEEKITKALQSIAFPESLFWSEKKKAWNA